MGNDTWWPDFFINTNQFYGIQCTVYNCDNDTKLYTAYQLQ